MLSKDADQPVCASSLIRVFAVCKRKPSVLSAQKGTELRIQSDCVKYQISQAG